MIAGSPATAPKRDDLPFLRRRSRPSAAAPPEPPALAANRALAAFIASGGRPTPPTRPPSARSTSAPSTPAPSSADLDLSAPSSADLDLSAPSSADLDLSAPTPPAADLDVSSAPAPSSPARPAPAKRRGLPRRGGPRTQAGRPFLLTGRTPTVTLTRTQSGVGGLSIEALFSDAVGDLRLACPHQLRSGRSTLARSGTAAPIYLDQRGRIIVDLRHVRDIERFAVVAYSHSRATLQWGGTLVVTTFGGARIETPLDRAAAPGAVVYLSAYNVRGELVLRAEHDEPSPSVREACKGFGYERITWLDDRTPVD